MAKCFYELKLGDNIWIVTPGQIPTLIEGVIQKDVCDSGEKYGTINYNSPPSKMIKSMSVLLKADKYYSPNVYGMVFTDKNDAIEYRKFQIKIQLRKHYDLIERHNNIIDTLLNILEEDEEKIL